MKSIVACEFMDIVARHTKYMKIKEQNNQVDRV